MKKLIPTILALVIASISPQANAYDIFGIGENQFEMSFVTIGDPENAPDLTGVPSPIGSTDYIYRIGKFEVAEHMIDFANAQSAGDGTPLNLSHANHGFHKPATSLSWTEMTHFVNWLNTSTGNQAAYKYDAAGRFLTWEPGDSGYNANNRFRNSNAKYFLPSVDEWYKAAYYDPVTKTYFDFPTGSNTTPDGIDFHGDTQFDAVFSDGYDGLLPNDVTNVGLLSPFGTAGQGGNVWEYLETEFDGINDSRTSAREFRGSKWRWSNADELRSNYRGNGQPHDVGTDIGFRVASVATVPEPSGAIVFGTILFWFGLSRKRR